MADLYDVLCLYMNQCPSIGNIVYTGVPEGIKKLKTSLTGQYLSGEKQIQVPKKRVVYDNKKVLKIHKAHLNNLQNLDVSIPVGLLTCVTGVSNLFNT